MELRDLLNVDFFGNPLWRWGVMLGVLVASMIALRIVRNLLAAAGRRMGDRIDTELDDAVEDVVRSSQAPLFFLVSLYAGSLFVTLPAPVPGILRALAIAAGLLQAGLWASALLSDVVRAFVARPDRSEEANRSATVVVTFLARLALWAVVVLLALENIPGVDVTSLVAGLGITGIAVALAVQNILGDLFASLTILLDQPFAIGDFIVVGDLMGTVEHVGLKSTRVRSLGGEELVFSNAKLLDQPIRNFKKMEQRRVEFTVGVLYETPAEKLEQIPHIVREAIEAQPDTTFDRSHFAGFGDFALNFENVYYLLTDDYDVYMDVQQAINLHVLRRFQEEGIEFAYPTQLLYLNNVGPGAADGQTPPRNAYEQP